MNMRHSKISFKVSNDDLDLISKIIARAMRAFPGLTNRMELSMDLCACIANGCPLKLDELLTAPSHDFAHDVLGIRAEIDRRTGKMGVFLPRYAKDQ